MPRPLSPARSPTRAWASTTRPTCSAGPRWEPPSRVPSGRRRVGVPGRHELVGTVDDASRAVSTRIGIVGLPNAGKSSLFNALTRAGAEAAAYPFTTIEPNVAVVPVADERLDRIAAVVGSSLVVPGTI